MEVEGASAAARLPEPPEDARHASSPASPPPPSAARRRRRARGGVHELRALVDRVCGGRRAHRASASVDQWRECGRQPGTGVPPPRGRRAREAASVVKRAIGRKVSGRRRAADGGSSRVEVGSRHLLLFDQVGWVGDEEDLGADGLDRVLAPRKAEGVRRAAAAAIAGCAKLKQATLRGGQWRWQWQGRATRQSFGRADCRTRRRTQSHAEAALLQLLHGAPEDVLIRSRLALHREEAGDATHHRLGGLLLVRGPANVTCIEHVRRHHALDRLLRRLPGVLGPERRR